MAQEAEAIFEKTYGTVDEGISTDRYNWHIHDQAILVRKGIEDTQPKLWIEAIKPVLRESRA
jgi:hypothetical protein